MDWMTGRGVTFAYGAEYGYLVIFGEAEVRLTRFSIRSGTAGLTAVTAREAAVSTIIFPLGRGPGRPGGQPELDALASSAKVFAEGYEAGESLDGYPAWQHPLVTKTGRVLTDADVQALADEAERGYDISRFLATGNADDCPSC